jgi:hypothetical protein
MTAPLAAGYRPHGALLGGHPVARSRPAGGARSVPDGTATDAEGALALTGRTWAALGALGFGLVASGTGAGHLEHHLAVGVALAAAGIAAIGWAVLALRGPAPAPRAAVAALLVTGPATLLSAPLTGTATTAAEGAALVLALGAAILLALGRRAAGAPGRLHRLGGAGQAGVLALGALLVALVTVPGLAATEAGAHAIPHGSHGLPAQPGHAGHRARPHEPARRRPGRLPRRRAAPPPRVPAPGPRGRHIPPRSSLVRDDLAPI